MRLGQRKPAGGWAALTRASIPSRDWELIISLCSASRILRPGFALVFNTMNARLGTLCSDLVPDIQKGCGLAGESPKGRQKYEQWRGKPDMREKAERTGCVQP